MSGKFIVAAVAQRASSEAVRNAYAALSQSRHFIDPNSALAHCERMHGKRNLTRG